MLDSSKVIVDNLGYINAVIKRMNGISPKELESDKYLLQDIVAIYYYLDRVLRLKEYDDKVISENALVQMRDTAQGVLDLAHVNSIMIANNEIRKEERHMERMEKLDNACEKILTGELSILPFMFTTLLLVFLLMVTLGIMGVF